MKLDRNKLIEKMAEQMTDDADLDTIKNYFYDGQVNFLDDLSDADLLNEADWAGFDTSEYEHEQFDTSEYEQTDLLQNNPELVINKVYALVAHLDRAQIF